VIAASVHPLAVGARVRHYGQQYPEAKAGTATILQVKPQSDGHYEYQVQRDAPLVEGLPNTPTWWASYMTYPALTA
jgi:hypothetical protein